MKAARLNRLFHPKSRRCFDVAIDHGFFNEYSFLAGIENIEKAVTAIVAAGPDAIQLTVTNLGDRPVQVGSHYHFAQANQALEFDRCKSTETFSINTNHMLETGR